MAGAQAALPGNRRRSPARAVRQRPGPGRAADRRGGRALPGLLQEPGHRRDHAAARRAGRGVRRAGQAGCDVPRRAHQRVRRPAGAARRPAHAGRPVAGGGRHRRRGRGARGDRPDGGLRQPGQVRRLEGPHRQAGQERRQRRHRRIRSRPGDGVRGAAPLRHPRPGVPVRVQRGLHRLRRGDPRPGPGRDAVHHLLQDVQHAGDADQRHLGA